MHKSYKFMPEKRGGGRIPGVVGVLANFKTMWWIPD